MKDAYYFSHDANARHDPKMIMLRAKYKNNGYACFFMILEMMREAHNYRLKKSEYLYNGIAIDFNECVEYIQELFYHCFAIDLLQQDDEWIWSESFLRRMERKEKMSKTRSDAGKLGSMKKWQTDSKPIANGMANAWQTNSSKVKESKGKERKETTIPQEFAQFWQAYPKKVGKDCALKSWNTKKPDLKTCLTALAWQTRQFDWTKEQGKFIPMPATWLNQGRWLDEPLNLATAYPRPIIEPSNAYKPIDKSDNTGWEPLEGE